MNDQTRTTEEYHQLADKEFELFAGQNGGYLSDISRDNLHNSDYRERLIENLTLFAERRSSMGYVMDNQLETIKDSPTFNAMDINQRWAHNKLFEYEMELLGRDAHSAYSDVLKHRTYKISDYEIAEKMAKNDTYKEAFQTVQRELFGLQHPNEPEYVNTLMQPYIDNNFIDHGLRVKEELLKQGHEIPQDVVGRINRLPERNPEVENSISPDLQRMMQKQAEQAQVAEEYARAKTAEEERSKATTPEQQQESEALEKEQPEQATEEVYYDIEKELSKKLCLDLDYDHPPGTLKSKYLVTEKGDYIDLAGATHFMDKGGLLKTSKNDLKTIQDMLVVAEEKGWSSINLTGTREFRRAAWLEATARGIEANGYIPNEKDMAILSQMREERSINRIDMSPSANRETDYSKPLEEREIIASDRLVEHGKANYQFNEREKPSYYVTVETPSGELRTQWGVGLEDAVKNSGAEIGDPIKLENLGQRPVEVKQAVYGEDGKTVIGHETISTHRNEWEIKVMTKELNEPNHEARLSEQQAPEHIEREGGTERADDGVSKQRFDAEKDKVLNQNTRPSHENIEASERVDQHGADVPLHGVGKSQIKDELLAFMNSKNPRQGNLSIQSLKSLKNIKQVAVLFMSGLDKESRAQAIRNFEQAVDKSIDGKHFNERKFAQEFEKRSFESTRTTEITQTHTKEQELDNERDR